MRAEIYDLSTDKGREFEAPSFCDRARFIPSFHMYHEGIFYWRGDGESMIYEVDLDIKHLT